MLTALLALITAATHAPEPPPLSAAALMRHVRYLADPRLAGRAAGSAGEADAAGYVAAELERAGLQPARQAVPLDVGGSESTNVHALLAGRAPARDRPGLRALVDRACAPASVVAVAAEDLPGPIDAEITRQSVGRGDSEPFAARRRAGRREAETGNGQCRI